MSKDYYHIYFNRVTGEAYIKREPVSLPPYMGGYVDTTTNVHEAFKIRDRVQAEAS